MNDSLTFILTATVESPLVGLEETVDLSLCLCERVDLGIASHHSGRLSIAAHEHDAADNKGNAPSTVFPGI